MDHLLRAKKNPYMDWLFGSMVVILMDLAINGSRLLFVLLLSDGLMLDGWRNALMD